MGKTSNYIFVVENLFQYMLQHIELIPTSTHRSGESFHHLLFAICSTILHPRAHLKYVQLFRRTTLCASTPPPAMVKASPSVKDKKSSSSIPDASRLTVGAIQAEQHKHVLLSININFGEYFQPVRIKLYLQSLCGGELWLRSFSHLLCCAFLSIRSMVWVVVLPLNGDPQKLVNNFFML